MIELKNKDFRSDRSTCEDHVGNHSIDANYKNVLLGNGIWEENSSYTQVNSFWLTHSNLLRFSSRQEILRCFLRLMLDSLQMLFSHTYVCTTFLIIFSMMWMIDLRFDTRFFAIAACMLGYIEVSVLNFGIGIHSVAQYFSAEKRIRVSWNEFLACNEERYCRNFCYLMNPNEMIDYCRHPSKTCEWLTRTWWRLNVV